MKNQLNTKITLENYDELFALQAAIRMVAAPQHGSPLYNYEIQEYLLKFQRKLDCLKEKENGSFTFMFNKEQKENLSFALDNSKQYIEYYMIPICSKVYNKLFKK